MTRTPPSRRAHRALLRIGIVLLFGLANPLVLHAFSLDDPAGPQFTEAQKQSQREAGKRIVPLVTEAVRSGVPTLRIPPGDYRFGTGEDPKGKVLYLLEFEGLHRPEHNPLTIDASEATFWFELGDHQFGYKCMRFRDCSHLIFQGATLDRDPRGHLEGRITQLDFKRQRIEIQLSPGVHLPAHFNQNWDQRILPFKADGRFCAPLYFLQKGGVRLTYGTPSPSETSGRVWIPLQDPALLNTIRDPQWKSAHGELGTLEVGDGISCIYSRTQSILLQDSHALTMRGLRIHIAKGCPGEEGGEGGHLWTHCELGPRPGTSQWQGGDGFMFNATRRGTTLEHVRIEHSTDDPFNVHGYWSEVEKTQGREVAFVARKPFINTPTRPLLKTSLQPGDRLRFYDKESGACVGSATALAFNGDTVTLDQSAEPFAHTLAEWPDHQCAGWTVRDCEFRDCYQRMVIKSGPGSVLNSRFIRMGKGIELSSVLPYVEGTVPRNIRIDGNRFEDVNSQPSGVPIRVYSHAFNRSAAPWLEDISITNNVFRLSGSVVIELKQVTGGLISGNRIERAALAAANGAISAQEEPIRLINCRQIEVRNNWVTGREKPEESQRNGGAPTGSAPPP
ncbi:MAG: hypothetical protein RLZZ142_1721 [Verrucomicrobiota bacterium]|jgi:hypothetical protein